MIEEIRLKFKRVSRNYSEIPLPEYATLGSAGMDVHAAISEPVKIIQSNLVLIPSNLSVEIPRGYEIQVRPRSGLAAKHKIGLLNSPGTIDSDYRGEIKIILMNFGKEDFIVQPGDRIAQLVLAKVYRAVLTESESIESTERGEGGFGHTGK